MPNVGKRLLQSSGSAGWLHLSLEQKLKLLALAAARKRTGVLNPDSAAERQSRAQWIAKCREDLYSWDVEALKPLGFKPAAHHRLLIKYLEKVANGEITRLMITMPPGSSKSTYASHLFPVWLFENNPNLRIIGASHTISLALAFSAKIQEYITENPDVLTYRLRTEQKQHWTTTNGGSYLAAGVGTAIPGYRADVGIIDDPVRGREAADSATDRETVWRWYLGSFERRLVPGAAVIVILTRWHEDDLAGRLLTTYGDATNGGQWTVLSLPAEAEAGDLLGRAPGEWLWGDDDYGYGSDLPLIKASLEKAGATREWVSQFQQRPRPVDGSIFKVALIGEPLKTIPVGHMVRAWDLAATRDTGKRDPSWTRGVKLMRTELDRYVVMDVQSIRGTPDEVEHLILQTAFNDGKRVRIGLPQDPGQAGKPLWVEELVLMASGIYKRLGDIKIGDVVINLKGQPTEVTAIYEQGMLPTISISTQSGRKIISALDHPFLTPNGWMVAKDLGVGSVLGLLSRPACSGGNERSDEEFRLAGYFIGDGATGRGSKYTPNGSCHAEFVCADALEIADFSKCVASLGGSVVSRPRPYQYGTKGLQNWLREVGLNGSTAYTKRVPHWVFEASSEKIANFVGAYFACDGWISKDSREVVFYSVSKALLEDVQHLLLRLGISSTLRRKNGKYLEKRHESWLLRMRQQDDAYGRFLHRVPVYHSTKRASLERLAADSRYRRFDEAYLPDAIVSIEASGMLPCRCIAVNEGASFTANDFVVHNSQASYYIKKLAGYTVEISPETGDKATRAAPIASQCNIGNLDIMEDNAANRWNRAFKDELAAFPSGAHEDMVDALSRAFGMLLENRIPFILAPEVRQRMTGGARNRFGRVRL